MMYEANFTLDTLLNVSNEMNSFASSQSDVSGRIYHEVLRLRDEAYRYVIRIEERLKAEEAKLDHLLAELSYAESRLSNCHVDEDGNGRSERDYWGSVVRELQYEVERQRELIARVKAAVELIKSKAETVRARTANVEMENNRYKDYITSYTFNVATAIKRCADALTGYWTF